MTRLSEEEFLALPLSLMLRSIWQSHGLTREQAMKHTYFPHMERMAEKLEAVVEAAKSTFEFYDGYERGLGLQDIGKLLEALAALDNK